MKKIIYLITFLVFYTGFSQVPPARFDDGVRMRNATEDLNPLRIPTITSNGTINEYITTNNLFSNFQIDSATHGNGAPIAATPIFPTIYVDDSTGEIYTYDGTTWNLSSSVDEHEGYKEVGTQSANDLDIDIGTIPSIGNTNVTHIKLNNNIEMRSKDEINLSSPNEVNIDANEILISGGSNNATHGIEIDSQGYILFNATNQGIRFERNNGFYNAFYSNVPSLDLTANRFNYFPDSDGVLVNSVNNVASNKFGNVTITDKNIRLDGDITVNGTTYTAGTNTVQNVLNALNTNLGDTDTNVTSVSSSLDVDRKLDITLIEDGTSITNTDIDVGSPVLSTSTDKSYIEGVDSGDVYFDENVYFDGKVLGLSTTANSITFGKTVDSHNTHEYSFGLEAGQGATGDFINYYGSFTGKNAVSLYGNGFGYNTLRGANGANMSGFGHQSGTLATDATNLTALGYFSGNRQNGQKNTFIGSSSGELSDCTSATGLGEFSLRNNTFDNVTGVGARTLATKDNQVVLGDVNVLEVFTEGAIVTNLDVTATAFVVSSDSRLKTIGNVIMTETINNNSVNIYEFTYTVNGESSLGYVAQELETALQGLSQSVIDMIIVKKKGVDVNATLSSINNAYSTTHTTLNDAIKDQSIKDAEILQSIRDNNFPLISLSSAILEYDNLRNLETLTANQQDRLDRYNLVNWSYNILAENQVIVNDIRSIDINKLNFFK